MTVALLAILLAPLFAAAVSALFPERARRLAGPLVATAAGVSLICAALAGTGAAEASLPWFELGRLEAELTLAIDPLGALMAMLIAFVSLVIDVYSIGYLRGDPRRHIFFAWMSFFSGAMLALVLAHSLFLLFAAWEAVSVASYALIAFHHRERAARRAASRAFVVTRLGDLGLLLAAVLLFVVTKESGLSGLFARAEAGAFAAPLAAVAGLGVLVAAIAKSAQLPLSAWLPDAMIAPTPVSALLHSATMVAAGVYLLLRFEPLLSAAPLVSETALWVGAVTAVAAALIAATSADLKRVLAWSTVSNLGEMLVAVGHAVPQAAALHLTAHAFFKSCLFLVAGAVDQRAGSRELERLGGLARGMPLAMFAFVLAGASLAGVPPLAGFYSGEALVGAAAAAGTGWVFFQLAILLLAGAYIGRAGAAVFLRWPGAPQPTPERGSVTMSAAIVILAAAAAGGGLLTFPIEHHLTAPGAPSPPALASAFAVAAGVLGLGFGVFTVLRAGPAPAFGAAPSLLERAAEGMLAAPARAARAVAGGLLEIEGWLDRAAANAAAAASRAARAIASADDRVLDRAARGAGAWTLASARGAVALERGGFGRAGDELAASLSLSGKTLRALQNGKLYFYTASLFVAAFAIGGLLVVLAIG